MSAPKSPEKGVISLLDRLPPPRRARHLATLAARRRALDDEDVAKVGDVAEQLEKLPVERSLSLLGSLPYDDPEMRDLWYKVLSIRAGKRLLAGEVEEAIADWDEIMARDEASRVDVLLHRGALLSIFGDHERGLADVERAVALAPTNARAYSCRGNLYKRLGRDDEAVANYRRAVQLDEDDYHGTLGLAEALLDAGDDERAIKWFTRAMKIRPRRCETYTGRASCYEHLGRIPEAIADLERAIAIEPDDFYPYHARGRCQVETHPALAAEDYARAIELDPETAEHWAGRARACIFLQKWKEAADDVERALALNPELADAVYLRGMLELGHDQKAALASFAEAARLEPGDLTYVAAQAALLERQGDIAGARAVFDREIARDPTSPTLHNRRAELLLQEGRPARALEDLDVAEALADGLPESEREVMRRLRVEALAMLAKERGQGGGGDVQP